MGYYSDFEISFPSDESFAEGKDEFGYDSVDVEGGNRIIYISYRKWYECQIEMAAFSTRFPNQIFMIDKFGEQPKDICRYYFQNGRVQIEKATILFNEFDGSKLKDPE